MSARPEIPADEAVNIEINGQPCQARKGAMIIEVTDELGISVPRFCYHKKLSVAANCRMCMVEVEKVPKPLPACATPVTEGMKVFTQSDIATSTTRWTARSVTRAVNANCRTWRWVMAVTCRASPRRNAWLRTSISVR
jgi:predicted molibdopterin-dependent oxidoreductase YjgC